MATSNTILYSYAEADKDDVCAQYRGGAQYHIAHGLKVIIIIFQ